MDNGGSGRTKITAVSATPVLAHFKAPLRFGASERITAANVIIQIKDDAGNTGYGEACPVSHLTSETAESVTALVERRVAPALINRSPLQWRPIIVEMQRSLVAAPFTVAGVDMALLDLAGKTLGVPVVDLLGGRYRDEVEVHGTVGWDRDPAAMADAAGVQAKHFGRLKIYVGPGSLAEDLNRLRAVRESVGDDYPLMIDVNGGWDLLDALRAGPALRDLGIILAEQPVSPQHAAPQAEVTRVYGERYGIGVVADERVRSSGDVLEVARMHLAHIANVSVSKLGGLVGGSDASVVAATAGLPVLVGSVAELGIAAAAGLHLAAALPRLDYPAFLEGPLMFTRQLTWPRLEPVGGRLPVSSRPGLGIDIDEEALVAMNALHAS